MLVVEWSRGLEDKCTVKLARNGKGIVPMLKYHTMKKYGGVDI
jgi:hypothetical protein